MKQGEAICYTRDANTLLTCSEGVKAPVFRIALR
jgi:hypothetical protein